MKLKKFFSLIATGALTAALFTGCGGETPPPDIKIGMIKYLNASETTLDELVRTAEQKTGHKIASHVTTFYDSLPLLEMGLESGSVDEASTYRCVADYFIARNPKVEIARDHNPLKLSDSFGFAMRAADTELKNSVDAALKAMTDDGTLADLTKTYIDDLTGANDPPAVAIETYADAEPLKIGITGDLPPLDLILADGTPSGFNTAMLAELGRRLHRNIEIIQIDSASRAAALTSGKIDIAFWAVVPVDSDMPADLDKPAGLEISAPYFRDEIVHVTLKK